MLRGIRRNGPLLHPAPSARRMLCDTLIHERKPILVSLQDHIYQQDRTSAVDENDIRVYFTFSPPNALSSSSPSLRGTIDGVL